LSILAVTGLAVLSSAGMGTDLCFQALCRGTPVSPTPKEQIRSFDTSPYDALNLVEVMDFDPTKLLGDKGLRTLDRITKLLVVATRMCLHDAGLKAGTEWQRSDATKVGFVCSNAYGSLEAITELDRVALLEDARYINPAKFPNTVSNSAAGYVSIWEDLRALNVSVSNGNPGALDAVGIAEVHLATARADAIVVGGGEAMCEALFLAFKKLGALRAPSFCLGEGAAMVCLEPELMAESRGAKIHGRVLGYGTHFVAPKDDALLHPSAEAMGAAIDIALESAGIAAKDVDLVVSGLSGLAPFDAAELSAINGAVGKNVPITAPKKVLGETLGAGGALGIAAALHARSGASVGQLERGKLRAGDPPRHVVVTSLGYYGNASALVVS
jgi:3-oxoacyl-(acyl-carrier-protein) synthase